MGLIWVSLPYVTSFGSLPRKKPADIADFIIPPDEISFDQ